MKKHKNTKKPFQCPFCLKETHTKNLLTKHLQIHHDLLKIYCKKCHIYDLFMIMN